MKGNYADESVHGLITKCFYLTRQERRNNMRRIHRLFATSSRCAALDWRCRSWLTSVSPDVTSRRSLIPATLVATVSGTRLTCPADSHVNRLTSFKSQKKLTRASVAAVVEEEEVAAAEADTLAPDSHSKQRAPFAPVVPEGQPDTHMEDKSQWEQLMAACIPSSSSCGWRTLQVPGPKRRSVGQRDQGSRSSS